MALLTRAVAGKSFVRSMRVWLGRSCSTTNASTLPPKYSSVTEGSYSSWLNTDIQDPKIIIPESRYKVHVPNDLFNEMEEVAAKEQTPVSLRTLVETGKGDLLTETGEHLPGAVRQQVATFLHRELPVRIAQRAMELHSLPFGLSNIDAIQQVFSWYVTSFQDIQASPLPETPEEVENFTDLLQSIYSRHAETLVVVAEGLKQLKRIVAREGRSLEDITTVHTFLDNFFVHRIAVRMLIGQFLALRHVQNQNWVGLICLDTSPSEKATQAAEHARYMCERHYGMAPEVKIKGRMDLTFPYVPSHLYYMLFELLKNSMRATVEYHQKNVDAGKYELPPVQIVIADGRENEDVTIKISDEGGGIPRSHLEYVFSYLYTTVGDNEEDVDTTERLRDFGTEGPLAGLGYGLPIARAYARYFRGDLILVPMEGYGVDAFLHVCRLQDTKEDLT
eukprot:m.55354 g.55354  ORF g.55354 m.55354 type:complete len:448 (+) comp10980_c0_seq1:349-1692(+)